MTRSITILDAPSNLGLRPPEEGAFPGCYKLPWAVRDRSLLSALGATDGGSVVPPRYRAPWKPGDGVRNAAGIAEFSGRLADRVEREVRTGAHLLVLGGDCSILLGSMLALRRIGRYGLVFLDAHSDFRHPGNAPAVGAAAGEELALVTGRGDPRLTDCERLGPYVREEDVHLVGLRSGDDYLEELGQAGFRISTSGDVMELGARALSREVLETVTRGTAGFWIHLDVDVVDGDEMPAADCPEPDGISFAVLAELLGELVASPRCAGMEVTIYDPDLDPTGESADRLVECLRTAYLGARP